MAPISCPAFYCGKKARIGPPAAHTATAHRIARTVYFILKHHVAYVDLGAQAYDQHHRQRELAYLSKKAARLGFNMTPAMPTAPSPNT